MSGQVCILAIRAIAVASEVVVSLILVMARSGHIYSTNTHTFSSSLKFLRDNMHACIFQDSASSLTLCPANNGISKDTVHVTLRAYVDVFLRTANDSYSKSLTKKTVVSFLGALRGLVSIGHILLEALGQTHPRESLSEYAYNYDVKAMHREFHWQMTGLEDGIR